jgi:hypothetical protein
MPMRVSFATVPCAVQPLFVVPRRRCVFQHRCEVSDHTTDTVSDRVHVDVHGECEISVQTRFEAKLYLTKF